tara:strand:- start:25455 stop:26822 length:1368 start_codon:yes stop_codon:yes gene_type:complete
VRHVLGELLDRLVPAGFARHVSVLVGGTAFAQALMLLALPVLTRLYTPDDFAVLAVYASLLAILASVACLRLEIAIPMPEQDEVAVNLIILALLAAVGITMVVCLGLLLFSNEIAALLGKPALAAYLWLVPIGLLGSASFAATQYWMTRKKRFPAIARARIRQSTAGVSTQLLFGYFAAGPFGLILGQVITLTGGVILLGRSALRDIRPLLNQISARTLRATLAEYQKFPKFSTLEAFSNSGAVQLPVLLIAAYVAGPEVGFLMLAMKIMAVPMTLLGTGVGQVYLSQASEHYREGKLPAFTAEVLKNLCRIGAPLILIGGLLAPHLFPLVFGREWQRAGELVLWMVPWFVFQFMSAPISMALHVTSHQKVALGLQLAGLAIRVLSVLAAVWVGMRGQVTEAYILSGAAFYALYLVTVLVVVKVPVRNVVRALLPGTAACVAILALYGFAFTLVS